MEPVLAGGERFSCCISHLQRGVGAKIVQLENNVLLTCLFNVRSLCFSCKRP